MASVKTSDPRNSTGGRSSRGSTRNSRERSSLLRSPAVDKSDSILSSSTEDIATVSSIPNYSAINAREGSDSGSEVTVSTWRLRRTPRCHCHDRVPKGKGFFLVFVLNVLESFAFYGAIAGTLHLILREKTATSFGYAITIALQYCLSRLFYPLCGFIADTYLGRYRVIHISLWLFWISYGLLAIALSLYYVSIARVFAQYVLPITAFVLLSVGAAGFETNIIPFGVDQLSQGASSSEMSSYFYWYYFGRQLGILGGLLTFFAIFIPLYAPAGSVSDEVDSNTVSALQPLIVLVVLTVAVLLVKCLQDWLFKDKERENPIKLVINVVWFAATARRHMPRYRRAFRYGEGIKPRIELAKIDYDGIYHRDVVEDVKTFCRIFLLLFSFGGYFMSYTSAFVMLSYQVNKMLSNATKTNAHIQTYLFPNIFNLWDVAVILLCLPILNYLIIPYTPPSLNMKKRIGIGMLLNMGAVISAAVLEKVTHGNIPEHRLLWLMIPALLLSCGEMFVFITGLEFIYAQSPESMKGLLTGLFYFIFGVFSGGGTLIFYFCTVNHKINDVYTEIQDVKGINMVLWYYVLFSVIAFLGFVAYAIVAFLYTNRLRLSLEEEDNDNRRHAQRVFLGE